MKENKFPINSFTKAISDYIIMLSNYNKIHENVVASSILNACGFVLSDVYEVEVQQGWIERSNLWTVISLNSGMGKSVIMRSVYQPILDFQSELIKNNINNNKLANEWKQLIKATKPTMINGVVDLESSPELRSWLLGKGLNNTPPEIKKQLNLFSDDFTFEKLITMLDDNKGHGFLIRADEISGLFKTFNRYRQGNDEETFLKLWGYDTIKRDRIDENGISFVKCPIVSLFGATQREMLFDMYTDNRIKNGNVFRFLFTLDEELKTKNVFERSSAYNDILKPFLDHYLVYFDGTKTNDRLGMEENCTNFLEKWRNDCKIKYIDSNKVDILTFNSIMGKMDSYIIRIAIILNRLNNFFSEQKTINIRQEDLQHSATIVDFYFKECLNVLSLTSINYHKFLKSEEEIEFYENVLAPQQPYFELVKKLETELHFTPAKATNTVTKWIEVGLVKRNSKGIIYKKV